MDKLKSFAANTVKSLTGGFKALNAIPNSIVSNVVALQQAAQPKPQAQVTAPTMTTPKVSAPTMTTPPVIAPTISTPTVTAPTMQTPERYVATGVNAGIDPYTLKPIASANDLMSTVNKDMPTLNVNPVTPSGTVRSDAIGDMTYEDLFQKNNALQNLQRRIFESSIASPQELEAQARLGNITASTLTANKQLQDEINRLVETSNLTKQQAASFVGETQRRAQDTLANLAIQRMAETGTLSNLQSQRGNTLEAFKTLYAMNQPERIGDTLVNPVTGEVIYQQPATDELLSVNEAQSLGVPYGTTRAQAFGKSAGQNTLGGYNDEQNKKISAIDTAISKNATYTKTSNMRSYADNVLVSLSQGTGAGDLAAINQFQKVIDEGAVTRDQDVKLIQSSQSLSNRLSTYVNRLVKGEQLSPDIRREIANAVNTLYSAQINALEKDPFVSAKKKELERFGINPNDTIIGELGAYSASGTQTQGVSNAPVIQTSVGAINPNF
jgi:predicted XRE-type DNA-binding protein